MAEFRALGTIVKVTSTATLTVTIVLSDTVGSITLNASDAAYRTIATGSYTTRDYATILLDELQTWFSAAVTADAGITTKGTASVTLAFSPSTSANGSLFTLSFSLVGASNANGAITVTSATIDNASLAYSPLGLTYETQTLPATTTRSGTVSPATTVTWAGLYQPRSLFVLERSEGDTGDMESAVLYKVLSFADGTADGYESGRRITRRRLDILDLDEAVAGRPRVIGRTASSTPLAADRQTLNLQVVTLATNATLTGIANHYYDSEVTTTGRYARTPTGWVSRLRTGSSSSAILLTEKVPASTTELNGAPITQISEVHALFLEALRLKFLVVYEVSEQAGSVGAIRWVSEEYLVEGGEAPEFAPARNSPGVPLYTFSLFLRRRDAPGLTLAS